MTSDMDLLREQLSFYRQRAPEYDKWRHQFALQSEQSAAWLEEVSRVKSALQQFAPSGHVLELAAGTGWWTALLAQYADHLTVVDGAPEALDQCRQRLAGQDVDFIVRDLFNWTPTRENSYDVVFFSFWLSHVPPQRFAAFWNLVAACLAPGGRVFLVDNRADLTVRQSLPCVKSEGGYIQRRQLADGSEYRVVKMLYRAGDLTERLQALGWCCRLEETDTSFIFGDAKRA